MIGDYIVLGCPVPEEVASQIRFLRKSSNGSNRESARKAGETQVLGE